MRVAGIAKAMDGYVNRLDYACANRLPRPGTTGRAADLRAGLRLRARHRRAANPTHLAASACVGRQAIHSRVDIATSIVNDDSESQAGVLVPQKITPGRTSRGSRRTGRSRRRSLHRCRTTRRSSPTQCRRHGADVLRQQRQRHVPGGNRRSRTTAASSPVARTPITATYINDGNEHAEPAVPGRHARARTPTCSSPTSSTPSTRSNRGTPRSISIGRSRTMSRCSMVSSLPHVQELVCGRHRRLAARDSTAAASPGSRAEDAGGAAQCRRPGSSISRSASSISIKTPPRTRASICRTSDSTSSMARTWCRRTNQALYAHAALQLTDRLDLSLGVRYSEDEKSYTFRRRNPDLTPVTACTTFWFWETGQPANCGVFGLDLLSVAYSSDNTDYRVALVLRRRRLHDDLRTGRDRVQGRRQQRTSVLPDPAQRVRARKRSIATRSASRARSAATSD